MSSKKKVRPRELAVDMEEYAIVAHYTTDYLDSNGRIFKILKSSLNSGYDDEKLNRKNYIYIVGEVLESSAGVKKVRLPRDFIDTEIEELAQEVVEKCKYIPSAKLHEVQNLMAQMLGFAKSRTKSQSSSAKERPLSATKYSRERLAQHMSNADQRDGRNPSYSSALENLLPAGSWDQVDEYADLLYEDKMELKVRGAQCILRLCLDPKNLELLGGHDTLLGVLSRELRENYKKSHEIATSVGCIILCFSAFGVFHPTLMQHQCGDVSMRILEYESKRYQVRKSEREQNLAALKNITSQHSEDSQQIVRIQKEEKKYQGQLLRQNKLLHTVLHILMNLAEDVQIEKKMVNRGLAAFLCQLLDRSMEELLFVALTFLKKLSIFEENKDEMFGNDIVPKLVFITPLNLRNFLKTNFNTILLVSGSARAPPFSVHRASSFTRSLQSFFLHECDWFSC